MEVSQENTLKYYSMVSYEKPMSLCTMTHNSGAWDYDNTVCQQSAAHTAWR
jgi:hypothetical protein